MPNPHFLTLIAIFHPFLPLFSSKTPPTTYSRLFIKNLLTYIILFKFRSYIIKQYLNVVSFRI